MTHIYKVSSKIYQSPFYEASGKKVGKVPNKQIYEFLNPKINDFVKDLTSGQGVYDKVTDIKLNAKSLQLSFNLVVREDSKFKTARLYDFKTDVPSGNQVLNDLNDYKDEVQEEMYLNGKFKGFLTAQNIKVVKKKTSKAKPKKKSTLSVTKLKLYLKNKGCKGYSRMNKKELIKYLKECHKDMTVKELRAEAKLFLPKCRGYSKLNKRDLIRYLNEHCKVVDNDMSDINWMYN